MHKFSFTRLLAGFMSALLTVGVGVTALRMIPVSTNVKMEVNGEAFTPTDSDGKELPVFIYNGSTYAPVRALGEALDCAVSYSRNQRLVTVKPSIQPDYYASKALEEDLEKRIAQTKTVRFRDQDGRTAEVDALPDTEEDYMSSWLARLWGYNRYHRLEDQTAKPEDYQGSGIDVVFLDAEGDCLVKYKDISEYYVTINGEYYTNEPDRGGYLDVERIRRVLDGKPEEFEPEKLFNIPAAQWIVLQSGGESVRIDDPETVAQLTEELNSLEYVRGEPCESWMGWSYWLTWYDKDGHQVEDLIVNSPSNLRYKGFFRKTSGGQIDTARYDQLLKTCPGTNFEDTSPILTLPGALEADTVEIENGSGTLLATVTDPELVRQISENMAGIDFRVGEKVQGSAWDKIDDGRCFLMWSKPIEDDPDGFYTPTERAVCVLSDTRIAFNGAIGNYADAMNGKTIDKALLDELLDPNGAYANHPGVTYRELKDGGIV